MVEDAGDHPAAGAGVADRAVVRVGDIELLDMPLQLRRVIGCIEDLPGERRVIDVQPGAAGSAEPAADAFADEDGIGGRSDIQDPVRTNADAHPAAGAHFRPDDIFQQEGEGFFPRLQCFTHGCGDRGGGPPSTFIIVW